MNGSALPRPASRSRRAWAHSGKEGAPMSVLEAAWEQACEETSRIVLPATISIFLGLVVLGLLIDVFSG